MKIVIQRVSRASVTVSSKLVGEIPNGGLCLLIGFRNGDTKESIVKLVNKILSLKLFEDSELEGASSRWKKNITCINNKGILAVSQFTLYSRTNCGAKPDFHDAMEGKLAIEYFNETVNLLREGLFKNRSPDIIENSPGNGVLVATGAFGEFMNVSLINDGPVTIILDSDNWK